MERNLFDAEHDALRASFRAWLDKEVVPSYLEWERAGLVPHDLFVEAGRHGFLGMAIPEQYGGGGAEDFRYNLVIDEEVQASRRERRRASASRCTTTSACRTSCDTAPTSNATAGSRASRRASS